MAGSVAPADASRCAGLRARLSLLLCVVARRISARKLHELAQAQWKQAFDDVPQAALKAPVCTLPRSHACFRPVEVPLPPQHGQFPQIG